MGFITRLWVSTTEVFVTMNSFTITERNENQWIYQWICDIQTMWKISYLILQRIIVFELFEHWTMLIVFLFLVLTISKFYSWIFGKHDWTSNLAAGVLPIISVLLIFFFFFSIYPVNLSIYLSVLLSVMYFSQSLLGGFFKFFAWGCFAIYPKKWQRGNSENCVFCLDNWVNKINLDQKWNIWHFNKGNITFVL